MELGAVGDDATGYAVQVPKPEQGVCKGAQANFDVDALVHRIAGSITTSQGLDCTYT